MAQKKIIFGFVGQIASGKDLASEYLEIKYRASVFSFSKVLRDILDMIYLPHSRDNLIKLSEILRGAFGEDILGKTVLQDISKENSEIVVLGNIRRTEDAKSFLNLQNFVLTEIFADQKTRYERILKRAEKSDDQSKTYEEFLADNKRSTELSILEVAKLARERIDNNGTIEELYSQLDELVKKYVL